jgi:argininosuccinate lyase
MTSKQFHAPVWDRGEAIDAEMLAFTVGDDPQWDARLVEHDLRGSLAHAKGLAKVGLISAADHASLAAGLERLLQSHRRGEWTVEATDEDVHSAVERRLTAQIGEAGKRLHTARSRNEQIAVDLRLWLRDANLALWSLVDRVRDSLARASERRGPLPLPGYTHLRRAMPSTVGAWLGAHARAFELDLLEIEHAREHLRECPLGSGAGYGVPVELDRQLVARELGFEGPEEPVTHVQHARGRAELAHLTALEAVALDLGKLAADLWLYSAGEFGFVKLPVAFTTGSSLMPHKRNPDAIELIRAHARQIVAERAALLDVLRDLPSGYHRDFQLLKPPLFRAHDRAVAMLALLPRLVDALEFDEATLRAACDDPKLRSTERALEKSKSGVPFRDAYREESSSSGS